MAAVLSSATRVLCLSGAKVRYYFEICKFSGEKMLKRCKKVHFLQSYPQKVQFFEGSRKDFMRR